MKNLCTDELQLANRTQSALSAFLNDLVAEYYSHEYPQIVQMYFFFGFQMDVPVRKR
jgi:hypothetical protein